MKSPALRLAAALAFCLPAWPGQAVTCQDIEFQDQPYSVCEVAGGEDIRLWLEGSDGQILGSFAAIESELDQGRLAFAMNAGMYHENRQPVGLYIEHGRQVTPASDGGGYGNFGMLPNGIFCVSDVLRVWESDAFAAAAPDCAFATQSGPMLVIDGQLHPEFRAGSSSVFVRNGVGTSADGGRAVFAISNHPVNFDSFARLFRDHLGLPNALFLDANISRLYAPSLGRSDSGLAVGPIIGVVDAE